MAFNQIKLKILYTLIMLYLHTREIVREFILNHICAVRIWILIVGLHQTILQVFPSKNNKNSNMYEKHAILDMNSKIEGSNHFNVHIFDSLI